MLLNIWKDQTTIEKTVQADAYDIMLGTVDDILALLDDVLKLDEEGDFNGLLLELIRNNLPRVKHLLKEIFPSLNDEDLKRIKMKELIPLFVELVMYCKESMEYDGKNV